MNAKIRLFFLSRVEEARADGEVVEAELGEEVVEGAVEAVEAEVTVEAADEAVAETEDLNKRTSSCI